MDTHLWLDVAEGRAENVHEQVRDESLLKAALRRLAITADQIVEAQDEYIPDVVDQMPGSAGAAPDMLAHLGR